MLLYIFADQTVFVAYKRRLKRREKCQVIMPVPDESQNSLRKDIGWNTVKTSWIEIILLVRHQTSLTWATDRYELFQLRNNNYNNWFLLMKYPFISLSQYNKTRLETKEKTKMEQEQNLLLFYWFTYPIYPFHFIL